jgi:hypothetical protein
MGVVGTSPLPIGFLGATKLGRLVSFKYAKEVSSFERMVFEDEENGQWVVPIHMISASFSFSFQ